MQELKMQNGLLLQLVKGLQSQINSKNRENQILFQQYEQLAADNSNMRAQIDALKSKQREHNLDNQINSPRQQENMHLKQKIALLQEQNRGLVIQLDQKGGSIIFLQSQLQELKSKLASYQQQQKHESKTETVISVADQSKNVEDAQISNQLSRKIQSFEIAILEKEVLVDALSKQNAELKQKILTFENLQLRNRQSIDSLTAELNQQKLILTSNEQSVAQLGQFLSSLTVKSQEAAQKQQQIESNLKQALNRMVAMEQERELLKGEIAQLKQQKQKNQNVENKESEPVSQKEIEVDQKDVKLSTKQDELARANQIIAEKDRTITQCFERINQLSEKIQEMEILAQNRVDPNQQSLQLISTKEQTISQLSEYLNDHLKTITELRQKVKQLQDSKASQNKNEQQTQKLTLNEKISDLQNLLRNKEQSLVDMSAYIEENNQKFAKLQESYQVLLKQNEHMKQRLNNGEKIQSEDQTQKIKELEEKIAAKQVIIAEFTEFMNEQSLRVASIEQEKSRMLSEEGQRYQEIKQRIQELENVSREKEQLINILKAKNSEQQQKIKELQASIGELTARNSQQNMMSPQKMRQLQEILAKEGSLIVNLTQKVQQLEARQLEMQQQLEIVEQKYASKNKELEREQTKVLTINEVQQETSCVNIQQIQKLNQSISELEAIINSKSDTIAELSEFMNEQAVRITELQAQIENSQSVPVVVGESEKQKIADLEAIIKMKQQSATDLREYLEENASRNIELQKRVLELEAEAKKAQQEQQKQISRQEQIEVVGHLGEEVADEINRRQELAQLDGLIEQKKQQLQALTSQCVKTSENKMLTLKELEEEQNMITNLDAEKSHLIKEIQELKETLQDLLRQKQDLQTALKEKITHFQQLEYQISAIDKQRNSNSMDNVANNEVSELLAQKEVEINTLSDILQRLQDELRSKNQIIEYLQERGNQNNKAEKLNSNNEQGQKQRIGQYEQKIAQLENEVQNLRDQHKQLTQRLNSVQQSSILQEKYDFVGMERQLQLESKLFNNSYQQELRDMQETAKITVLQQRENEKEEEENAENEQKALNTGELLSQIVVYSEEGSNSKMLQKLIRALTQRYLAEFAEYEHQNKGLRAQLDNFAALKQTFEKKINTLNSEIKQLNQEVNQKNQLIESLHGLNGEKEQSFNEKIEEIRKSFQVTGNQFHLILNNKQTKECAEPITEEIAEQQFQILKKENLQLQQLIKELKEELQLLLAENKSKAAQIQSLKEAYKQPAMEKEFVDLLRDSDSNINEEGVDQHEMIQKLKAEKESLTLKCAALQIKSKELQKERQRHLQTIEAFKKQINQQKCQKSMQNQESQSKNKVMTDIYTKKQQERMQSQMSEEKEQALVQKIIEKNEIIAELEETVLKLQKGYNHEIMQLRKNNAELNSEIINLTKKVYLLDPNSIDIADFVKETCRQAVSETEFYKSRYNLKYTSHYSQVEVPHNMSYVTENSRSKRYEPFFGQRELNLGEKIIGRRCRGEPLNYTINNDYRLNASAWDMHGGRPL